MTGGETDDGVHAAVDGEMALLDPAVRTSLERTAALLDDDFVEFGRSGRRWGRESLLTAMTGALSLAGETVRATEVRGVRLCGDVVHLTYVTDRGGSMTRRSSLWRRGDGGWRLYFHQATPVGDQGTRAAVLDHLAAFNAHDTEALVSGLHPDVVWATGSDVFAGTAEVRQLLDDGPWQLQPSLEVLSLVVDGDDAAARLTERLLVDGRVRQFAIAAFIRVVDGRIRAVTVYREGSADIPS